ncbi:sensor histidine kinase [Ekhidna sp.]|uniref:sensor histidine kinase n=1 Tax=Ekhidna sp. TaxID=2608089 RepID=UPI003B5144E7
MIKPEIPENEDERIKELNAYQVLDTLPEEDYDDLTSIAAEICNTNISLVSLIDENRQWFKSKFGLDASETPREYAFCAHAINEPEELFIVNDAREDERFHDNPLVVNDPNVTFYAGVPLVNEKGYSLGTLCVIDDKPKTLSNPQKKALKALGKQIMNILELRRKKRELESSIKTLEMTNEELDRFASVVAHDVKGPLVGINELIQVLDNDDYLGKESQQAKELVSLISNASGQLSQLVDRLLEYSKSIHIEDLSNAEIEIEKLKDNVISLFSSYNNLEIDFESEVEKITTNQSAVERILLNLVNNSIKYNDKDIARINISLTKNDANYVFTITDNGPGIPESEHDKVFEIFKVLEKDSGKGTGLGLAIVNRLVTSLKGSVKIETPEQGVRFVISLPISK